MASIIFVVNDQHHEYKVEQYQSKPYDSSIDQANDAFFASALDLRSIQPLTEETP